MSQNASDALALPARHETFLARYPRNLKLFVTALIFALMVLPPAWIHGQHRGVIKNIQTSALFPQEKEIEKWLQGNRKIETDVNAPALNDQDDRNVKLVQAPNSRVTLDTAEGSLPRIGEDGARPWQVYARPFNLADKRPRVAIVITDLGMSRGITDQAIAQTPPTVTLSFSSQSPVVGAWSTRARQDGHEILLQVPVEPFDYPQSDPGADTLLTNLSTGENLTRLLKALRRSTGYVGITTTYGSRFTSDPTRFGLILQEVKDRGLMVFDSRVVPHGVVTDMARNAGVPVATMTQRLDVDLDPQAVATAFENLEKTARQTGRAVGIMTATPVMINQLQAWAKTLPEHGIALAPLSTMVQ
ncbi:MAG: divergent polysaccharide deacetylase family protein [Bdellovibrionales bacterium]